MENSKGECGFDLWRVKWALAHDMASRVLKYPWEMEISKTHTEKTGANKASFQLRFGGMEREQHRLLQTSTRDAYSHSGWVSA